MDCCCCCCIVVVVVAPIAGVVVVDDDAIDDVAVAGGDGGGGGGAPPVAQTAQAALEREPALFLIAQFCRNFQEPLAEIIQNFTIESPKRGSLKLCKIFQNNY